MVNSINQSNQGNIKCTRLRYTYNHKGPSQLTLHPSDAIAMTRLVALHAVLKRTPR